MTPTTLMQVLSTLGPGKACSLHIVRGTVRRPQVNEGVHVFDKKGEDGESEYADLVRLMGGKPTPIVLPEIGQLLDTRFVDGAMREMQGPRHSMEAVARTAHDNDAIEKETIS